MTPILVGGCRWSPWSAVLLPVWCTRGAYPVALTPVVLLSIYTAASVLRQRRARLLLAGSVVVGIIAATRPGADRSGRAGADRVGVVARQLHGEPSPVHLELETKNQLLEAARDELARRAVTEERLRIARELHDVVAHTMSVVAVHAGTGRMVADDDPGRGAAGAGDDRDDDALGVVGDARMLGMLRSSDVTARGCGPAPGLGDLDALVAEVVRSGVTVEVRSRALAARFRPGSTLLPTGSCRRR